MKQLRLLWFLLAFYGFAVAVLSHNVLRKLDREFTQGLTRGMNHNFEPLFYIQSLAILIAICGGLLTLSQLRRINASFFSDSSPRGGSSLESWVTKSAELDRRDAWEHPQLTNQEGL